MIIVVYIVVGLVLIGIFLINRYIDFEGLSPEQQICIGCIAEHGACPTLNPMFDSTKYCRLLGSEISKDVI